LACCFSVLEPNGYQFIASEEDSTVRLNPGNEQPGYIILIHSVSIWLKPHSVIKVALPLRLPECFLLLTGFCVYVQGATICRIVMSRGSAYDRATSGN